ncbi:DNA-binding response regulator (plasmid) [Azospirillum brasilense]|uniref:DNA-binding response regulator n=1 Tax=Azospirillum brasilense TaxID=192 RepID=A0A4D8QP21_AZOBR|nr:MULTISPECIES: response regulator transcription factor [Azospirillum]MDW7556285.1 response regulator transcription factor [Azospirillum brasilense]MDW7594069.1 response regulator transcription factor [Azospirillum brasilense]MDW7631659.1 response regulator transcription factor [Azospirillum brasilense]MDX5949961.1 response regulator transcription factor [Azospirillum brasilense]OPH15503.1 regulator [Azospirillum brasilense]
MTLTILLVDDHPVVRAGCQSLLAEAGLGRVVEAADVATALALWRSERPDVVILDLNLPGGAGGRDGGGIEVLRAIRAENPAVPVLIFSMHEDPAIAARALKAGAKGYVTKNDAPETLVTAVRCVLAGRVHLDHALARELALMALAPSDDPLSVLTQREREILALVGRGLTAAAIAEALGISQKTVANACTQIKDKLGADSTRALIRIAIDHGLAA